MITQNYASSSNYRIIVVTTDKLFLEKLKDIFDRKCNFILSQPVDNLVKKACDLQPDLILKDLSNRKTINYQIFKSLKSDYRTHNIPIIIVTEKEKPGNIESLLRAGVSDNITKQFTVPEIELIIKTHLELKRKVEENKDMQMVKSKFFSIMTNDIKDSLIGVKGIAGFLLQDLENSDDTTNEVVKMARILYDDSKELYKFLENLIEWASIETDKAEIEPESFKLKDIVDNIINDFNKEICGKSLKVSCNFDDAIQLKTDKKAFNTIMLHLLSNAIKYSNKNGEIIVEAKSPNAKLTTEINVVDNGVGMDKEVVNNIFRLDTPHPKTIGTDGEKGTGLGLIICRSIIEKILGKIGIESTKHRGTKAIIEIPELK